MPDWEALYQAGDMGWDRGESSPALGKWLDQGLLTLGDRVLIPGCGQGYEVVDLAKLGLDVTGLDFAATAIQSLDAKLQQDGLQATTTLEDLFQYQPKQKFDVVYEQTCLCALEPGQRVAYEACLSLWLNKGGKLLLSMMQTGETGGPPFHCDWSAMQQLFVKERWSWQEQVPFVVPRWRTSPRFELGFVLIRL
ncbi:MAG: methyltransferase domain-containing protein [Mariprofundaceae bacterium]|nr:methyltransferase domain-containing protein [Mariprofundaceae bacterium]